jgi:hypothetical protein
MLADLLIWLVNTLFALFRTIVQAVLDLLPTWSVPDVSGLLAGTQPVFEWIGWANYYVPIDAALVYIGVRYGLYLAFHTFYSIVWALQRARALG